MLIDWPMIFSLRR